MLEIIEFINEPILIVFVVFLIFVFGSNKIELFSKIGKDKSEEIVRVSIYLLIMMLMIMTLSYVIKDSN